MTILLKKTDYNVSYDTTKHNPKQYNERKNEGKIAS